MEEGFVVRFRGVRGSHPVPGPTTLKYGGNTSCVEVWAGGRLIILDAGTGIIGLGNDLMAWRGKTKRPITAAVFFSHTHHDHTQGFPFFVPAYQGSSTLYMFGPKTFDQDLEEVLSRAMLPASFPVTLYELKAFKIISNIDDAEVVLIGENNEPQVRNIYREQVQLDPNTVRVSLLRSTFHPPSGVSLFRIEWDNKSIVYATDIEGVVGGDMRLSTFAQGAALLIHDAQYTQQEYVELPRQGWGHSTPEMATRVAQQARVGRLVLFHHAPKHDDAMLDDMEAYAQTLFPNTVMAYEGLTIRL
ncbi:MAG: MBL fold metallo-hydrolase [Anaerolineae bacterium]|nr:MBL fold metallo-hydrolase [Anaerolineae bacterium]